MFQFPQSHRAHKVRHLPTGALAHLAVAAATALVAILAVAAPAAADVIHAGETITTNVTWSAAAGVHIVTGPIVVAGGGSLTIQDGCTVRFDHGTWLQVNGTFNVAGTSGGGVLLTRRDPTDAWYGVIFAGAAAGGVVSWCTIEHATAGSTGAGVAINNGATPTVQHCTLRNNSYGISALNTAGIDLTVANVIQDNSAGGIFFNNCPNPHVANQAITGHTTVYGALTFRNSDGFRVGTGNTLTGNVWAVSMDLSSSPDPLCAGNIPLAGNTNNDGIEVAAGTASQAESWPDLGPAAYVVTGPPVIAAGGSLTIQDGCTVKFDHGLWLQVNGTLNVAGASGGGVLLTRRDPSDTWYGVVFAGAAAGGVVSWCTIEHATAGSTGAGVAINNGATPTVQHCTLRNNSYGISALNTAGIDLTVANVIQDNAVGGISFNGCANPHVANQTITGHTGAYGALTFRNCDGFRVGAGNTITGNVRAVSMDAPSSPDPLCAGNIPLAGNTNNDGIEVAGGSATLVETWPDLGPAAYVVTSPPTVAGGAALTIQDGCTVKFEHGTWLQVNGTLDIDGTGGGGVLLTRRDANDAWYGVVFAGAAAGGTLEHCTIELATAAGTGAGVTAGNGAAPTLRNCTLQGNTSGLVANNSSPHVVNTRIVDNDQYGVRLTGTSAPTFGASLAEWNEIHGNAPALAGRDFSNGLADVAARYVYWGTTVQAAIEARVHHDPDDAALGLVDFGPWTNEAHDQAFGAASDVATPAVPAAFALHQNVPNPFNPATVIRYDLPAPARVRITIVDVAGRRVATLADEDQPAGAYERRWNAEGLASGVYFCRLEAGSRQEVRPLTLLR